MKLIACCGLDCAQCEAYLATQTDDNPRRATTAKDWSARYNADLKPEQINCDGCRTEGQKFFYCANLCEIRKCVHEKELDNCATCDNYPCPTLDPVFQAAPQARDALDALRKQSQP